MSNLSGATTAVFIVSLSAALEVPVTVAWKTKDGTAKAGTDYEAASGSVTFEPGETTQQIQVAVYGRAGGDTETRTFGIELYPPENAILDQTLTEVDILVTDESGTAVTSLVVATGPRGVKGDPGLSSYELAKLQGYEGTLEEWIQTETAAGNAADRAELAAINAELQANNAGSEADRAEAFATTAANNQLICKDEADASAKISAGTITDGQLFYIVSQTDNGFVDLYKNVSGAPVFTGKTMPDTELIDSLEANLAASLALIRATGGAQISEAYPDIAELILDGIGRATMRRFADGTTQFPALMVGTGIEFVQLVGGGFVCQVRSTGQEIFKITSSGSIISGSITTWLSNEDSLSQYTEIHMDGNGRIYRRVKIDGTVEQVGDGGSSENASDAYPVVASVDSNIIAVNDDITTQITNDATVSNIAPVAYETFARFLSNMGGSFVAHRASYDGKYRARESLRILIHIIITGQSLAAGGSTKTQSPITTAAQADYGILSFATGPKVDFKYQALDPALLQSVIPCRENAGVRPGQESPSSGIAAKVRELTGHTVLVSDACSSGTALADISSGTATFEGGTAMIQAAAAMAEKLGLEYKPVMVFIHGNQNAASGTSIAAYRAGMESLRAQYETVINNATGGNHDLNMFVGQLSNIIPYGGTSGTTRTNNIGVAQYQEARDNPLIHLASAQYARPYSDGEHLTSEGYRTEGEVIGTVVGGWLNDNTKSALIPVESGVVQSGNTITIPVKGCVGSLVIDTSRVADPGNYGFLIEGATIASVAVSGTGTSAQIVITKTDSTAATRVSYAESGIQGQNPGALTGSRGCIRDSQTGTSLAGLPLYNDLAVFAFQLN